MLKSCLANATRALLAACALIAAVAQAQTPAPTPIIPAPPSLAATAYVLMDSRTGHILVEHNADQQLPPASLTKMLTAYIVVDELARGEIQAGEMVNISDNAWEKGGAKTGGSTMFLDPRTQVSVQDLLRGVIIQSGNDASIALAEHLAGSESAFADVMNQHAAQLGMTNSYFFNATGWPAEGHVSTARDMALLAEAIIEDHPEYYGMYAERDFTYNGIRQPNRNLLLGRDDSVDGLKTGHTEAAGYCLVASAKRGETRLIATVFGTRSESARAQETQALLNYGFRYFETHQLHRAQEPLREARVWKGQADMVSLGSPKAVAVTIPRGTADTLQVELTPQSAIKAPVAVGDTLGQIKVIANGATLYEGPLVALAAVEPTGFFGRLWDSVVLFITGLFD